MTAAAPLRRADQLRRGEQVAIYCVMLIASLGYNFSFILVDYIRPFLRNDGVMTFAQTAQLYTVQALGVIIGSFAIPPLVARLGSKNVLIGSSLLLGLCTFANEVVTGFAPWAATRFIVGIVLPGCYIASVTMLANLFPPRARGRLLSVNMAMFSVSLMVFGALGSAIGGEWRWLVRVAAILPLVVAVATLVFLPDDRRFQVYANDDQSGADNRARGSWGEMFASARIRLTAACLVIAGLNFSAYQFYSGFITTYLKDVRGFSNELTGLFVTVDGIGTLVGTVIWGIIADRYGRRANLWGFVLAAVAIGALLAAPTIVPLLLAIELCYAIGLSCTNCWAAYFAELFPVRLRSMGTSLFHGGHIVSAFAPILVTVVAAQAPLAFGMALAPLSFLIAAAIWFGLPETLRRARGYRGFDPETP
ncbi:MFS transporter [Sandaracinobacteroides saxicola]|uniref:MFS transporter n=1 Tax=Sandaracinobacteroides saxicola TaxID=2759707 RepID=A0A7G5IFB0_9SPHN|nr:MFS transporter [Sandaracinobacteroides saxicola]QMW22052.1 MFS transporter [Sandaracinobacteroides saxicola]